ncbi:MAG: hypothetical protein ACXV8L_09845 [Ilumatobacteraceae bacterium]
MTATLTLTDVPIGDRTIRRSAKVAGFTYVGAWVVGLTAFGVGPAADATDGEIARYFAGHRAVSAVQSLLIHGVAAAALLAVLIAAQHAGRSTRSAHNAGLIAVGLSMVQCVLDVWRSTVSTGSTTADLVHAIDRIDGLKMFALAAMIGASVNMFRSTGLIGKKMTIVGKVAAPALIVSGVAYAGHLLGLMVSADLSLLLLLIWVGCTGVAIARTSS